MAKFRIETDSETITLEWQGGELGDGEALAIVNAALDVVRPPLDPVPGMEYVPDGIIASAEIPRRCRRVLCGHPWTQHRVGSPESGLSACGTCDDPRKCRSYVGNPAEPVNRSAG